MKVGFLFLTVLFLSINLFSQTGPGGIGNSSSNILWLRSDAIVGLINGDTVTSWDDVSGNGNHMTQPTVALKPEYVTGSLNGFPIIDFNVSNSRLVRNPMINFPTNNITAIYVNKNNGESSDGVLSYASITHNNNFLLFSSNSLSMYRNGNRNMSVAVNDNNWHIVQASWARTNGRVECWKDGNKVHNSTGLSSGSPITAGGSLAIAAEQDAVNASYDLSQAHTGEFSEIMIFNTFLDTADHIIIANYLSAKFDITLAANNFYDEDEAVNGDFDFEVAGIGRHSSTAFNDDAQGSSILRISNPSNLDIGEYMIWGHNGAASQASNTSDVPGGIQARYERVWRVSEVNSANVSVDVGSVDIDWDLATSWPVTASDLRLLVDTDNDGFFIDETPIAGATHIGGDVYQFSSITALADNLRFTLATINSSSTTLPITLLEFTGNAIKNGTNKLSWITDSEINNDYFTVESSSDALSWQQLGLENGTGNSSRQKKYEFIDKNPNQEITYYRLSQTDFDGTRKELKTITVANGHIRNENYTIYPNPSNGKFMLSGKSINGQEVEILDANGSKVTFEIDNLNNSTIEIDISSSPDGIYFIQIANKQYKLILQK